MTFQDQDVVRDYIVKRLQFNFRFAGEVKLHFVDADDRPHILHELLAVLVHSSIQNRLEPLPRLHHIHSDINACWQSLWSGPVAHSGVQCLVVGQHVGLDLGRAAQNPLQVRVVHKKKQGQNAQAKFRVLNIQLPYQILFL